MTTDLCKRQKQVDHASRNPSPIIELQKPLERAGVRLAGHRTNDHTSWVGKINVVNMMDSSVKLFHL